MLYLRQRNIRCDQNAILLVCAPLGESVPGAKAACFLMQKMHVAYLPS